MKEIKKLMESLIGKLEEKVEQRQETFDSRTEKWQESEKGETYMDETDQLENMLENLRDWVDEIEEIIA